MVAPGEPLLVLSQGGEVVRVDRVSGAVDVRLLDAPSDASIVLLSAGGSTSLLSAPGAASTASWDTTTAVNGPYTLEARRGNETLAVLDVSVQNARAELGTAAAVVGTTTALAAGGSAVGSTLGSRAAMAAAQIGKESLMAVGEDYLALRTKVRARRMGTWMALALTLLLVTIFFAFEGLHPYALGPYLRALPIAGGVSMLFVAAALGVEYLLGFASRAATAVRFLGSGAVSLVLSSVLFRTPFGYPGYVEEVRDEDADGTDDEPPHVEGIRALASMTVFLALLLPFLWVGYRWNYAVVDQAMEVALVGLATSALPIRPLPGYDIWVWRRSVAFLYAVGAYMLYFGFVLAFLPMASLVPLGAAGAVLYVATFLWLRARTADNPPAWYLWALEQADALHSGAEAFTPKPVRAVARTLSGASHAAARGVDRAVHGLIAATKLLVVPVTALGARIQDRRFERARQAAAEVYARDLAAIMNQLQGLDDDDVFAIIGADGEAESHRVGDLRDDVYRTGLMRTFGASAPAIVTVVDGNDVHTVFFERDTEAVDSDQPGN